jgi:hypothetical protein
MAETFSKRNTVGCIVAFDLGKSARQPHSSGCCTTVQVKPRGANGSGSPAFTSIRLPVGVPKMLCSPTRRASLPLFAPTGAAYAIAPGSVTCAFREFLESGRADIWFVPKGHRYGRSGLYAVNIASGIDQTAGRLDRQFGAWIPDNAILRVLPILHMPRHGAGGSERS